MQYARLPVAFCLVLCSCTSHTVEQRRVFKDPLTGTDTMMRDVHLGDVEVTAAEIAPSAMTIITVAGLPLAAISCMEPKQCNVYAFNGRTIGATLQVSRDNSMPLSVQYSGTAWEVWDHNGTGQPDTRIGRGSKVVEILIDGVWSARRSTGVGRERRYYVGDREVSLSQLGWRYLGT